MVEASPDEPNDGEEREVPSEDLEAAPHPAKPRPRLAIPKSDLRAIDIVNMSAVSKIIADVVEVSRFARPEFLSDGISAIEGLRLQTSSWLKPALDAQSAWTKQFGLIDSDFFKTHAVTQLEFANLVANFAKTINLGVSDSVAKAAQQFAVQQLSWLKTLGPALEGVRGSFYPPNLRRIEDLEFEDVEKVVMADGIALYGVPRTLIARALLRADTAAKRREILGRRWKAISADCRESVGGFESKAVGPYVPYASAALDALDGGHVAPAQALAGSLIDSLLTAYFGKSRRNYTPDKMGKRTTKAYDEFTVRQFVAFAPMWRTYQQFWVDDGDTVPTTFSRNATAHAVSPRQFNRRNAIQALLFATSLLCFLDEQASRREAA